MDGDGPNTGLDIQKLDETKTGIKLIQKLMEDPNLKALSEGRRRLKDMQLEERSIVSVTNELFKFIDLSSGTDQTVFLFTIFNILNNILNYPYSDDQRILYLSRYKMKMLRMDPTIRFLKTLGFEPSTSAETLVFPYDKPLKWLLIAKEALIQKVSNKIDNT